MLWKLTIWFTVVCLVPYLIFFGPGRTVHVSNGWMTVLMLFLAANTFYFVLWKATECPKKTT